VSESAAAEIAIRAQVRGCSGLAASGRSIQSRSMEKDLDTRGHPQELLSELGILDLMLEGR
jgi:hypothetical protein